MIDYLTLALTHGLIALALWRLLFRPELDADDAVGATPRRSWSKAAPGSPDEDPKQDRGGA